MKKLFCSLIIALCTLGMTSVSQAQLKVSEAFIKAPKSVFPLLDDMTKLDMIDYYNSSLSTSSANVLDGKSRITLLQPQKMTIEMTNASTYEIDLLTTASGDTIITLISTVSTPAHDSQLTVYSSDWSANLTDKFFERPSLDDWLTAEGKNNSGEVEALVPFLLVSYSYNPEERALSLTNNTKDFLSTDIYDIVAAYLKPSITYLWNGKKFQPSK